ncbi:MAG TPA: bifunctional homocysteine S-methyltransferase/methylenetetrahydrofolate reductase [Candidatus Faecalibacterium intestinigallinarum]|uniref:Bifunctional homocysteine S-methyltransferase/methylenetetrahydrofolate reductase n=1 Tax=Candidatus Faecalibacterium intestinigallinarum TaxID=2838581 RepID=A0A9D1Q8V4_9FIRM|nr:bifunctional homocysteine S-methyltransferase/methylenetetrahydrofolate reductase [Candidatus Faecalibacterium intestinigallinarum]
MQNARDILKDRVLLFDGGMGTYYRSRAGLECEQANLADPEGVLAVHREYLSAGAEAIKTNTFSLPRMAAAGAAGWRQLAREGWRLAAYAAGDRAAVFADLGPAPDTEAGPAAESYKAVADIFLEKGAQNFLFETLSTDAGVAEAAAYIKSRCPGAFVLVSFAVLPDGYTREGVSVRALAARMAACGGVDAVGLNCLLAPNAMAAVLPALAGCGLPVSAMPNGGYPLVARDHVVYQGSPDYFAGEMCRIRQQGAVILGGCCGTTPAHIRAMRQALERTPLPLSGAQAAPASPTPAAPAPAADDPFLRKLAAGKKVIAVELDSPRNADLAGYMASARRLQAAGVDAVTIADCPIAQARVDAALTACKLRRELGLVALPHMTCRDRNLNAAKALLLGLYAEGVREVLAITGDPIPTAERDEVKNVYQFNSRKLAGYIHTLAAPGEALPGMTVFGALNLNARNFDVELRRAREKAESGMAGFLTQPILSRQALEHLRTAREALPGAKLLAGILPVVSHRNALYMENEVNGIHLDPDLIRRYEGADRARGEELALEISLAAAKAAAPYADGFYLMTPFNRVGLMEQLIAAIRKEVL